MAKDLRVTSILSLSVISKLIDTKLKQLVLVSMNKAYYCTSCNKLKVDDRPSVNRMNRQVESCACAAASAGALCGPNVAKGWPSLRDFWWPSLLGTALCHLSNVQYDTEIM